MSDDGADRVPPFEVPQPQLLSTPPYNPAQHRETIRGRLAAGLVSLTALEIICFWRPKV